MEIGMEALDRLGFRTIIIENRDYNVERGIKEVIQSVRSIFEKDVVL